MSYENNTRYIAEAWFNNEEEIEFKKSFMVSLLNEYQGENNGFDADTVDGKHWEDIQAEIQNTLGDTISPFHIGYTYFKDREQYYLGFDAIRLYDTETDDYLDEEKKLPWSSGTLDSSPNLLEVFAQLYNLTHIDDGDADVINTNQDLYNMIQYRITEAESRLEKLCTAVGNNINEEGGLNADTVNGIRFFIYTPAQYTELEHNASLYDPENPEGTIEYKNAYRKFNSIHNVFIIKDPEEIIKGGFGKYDDGIYDGNPDVAVIDKYYQFRVYTYDEDSEEKSGKTYLQYKYEDINSDNSTSWTDMCETSDFLDEEQIESYVRNYMQNSSSGYIIPDSVFKKALKEIEPDEIYNYPLIKYNRENYLKGGYYKNEELPIQTINNFLYLSLSPLQEDIEEKKQDVLNALNDYKTELQGNGTDNFGVIGNLNSNINTNTQNIDAIKGGSSTTIKTLEDRIASLNTSINNLSTNINNLKTWKRVAILGSTNTDDSCIIYNTQLKLAFFQVNKEVNYKYNTSYNKWTYMGTVPYHPQQGLYFPTSSHYHIVYIKYTGEVYYKSTYTKDNSKMVIGAGGMYVFN